MPLSKEQKTKILTEYKENLSEAKAVVLVDYSGIKVVDLQDLRKKLRDAKIKLKIAKNTLFKKALEQINLTIDEVLFNRPLALSFDSQDEMASSKIFFQKAEEMENLKILGGIINGKFVGPGQIQTLAKMPSREELYAKVVGSVVAPISGFVNVLGGNLRGLISVLGQYKEKISN